MLMKSEAQRGSVGDRTELSKGHIIDILTHAKKLNEALCFG